MRHRIKGRILGRKASHRDAMWRNMASSLIKTIRIDPEDKTSPKVAGRITTTLPKAKELRPYVEKIITLAKKGVVAEEAARPLGTTAARNTAEWKAWRDSDKWQKWNAAIAPAVNARRKAFSLLRDKDALEILFTDVAKRFETRNGGYLRIVRLPKVRLGDAGQLAFVEFVGTHDRVKTRRAPAPVVVPAAESSEAPAE
ncbi:MAG: 50S ribosomal protein L17 [Planctomycetaceae bacterium]|nr:50S ribosomal protein L17 [Planctomycetaceae bacterium]